jgi:hypothetical protein
MGIGTESAIITSYARATAIRTHGSDALIAEQQTNVLLGQLIARLQPQQPRPFYPGGSGRVRSATTKSPPRTSVAGGFGVV